MAKEQPFSFLKTWQEGEAMKDLAGAKVEGAQAQADIYNRGYRDQLEALRPYQGQAQQGFSELGGLMAEVQGMPTQAEQFQYNKTAQDFLDPSMQYEQDQARRQLEQSAVRGGGLMTGAMQKELQNQAMQIGRQGYGQAFNRMQQDRGFQRQSMQDRLANARAMQQDRLANLQNLISKRMGAGQFGTQGQMQAGQFRDQGIAGAKRQEFEGIGERRASGNIQAGGILGGLEGLAEKGIGMFMGGA